MLLGCVITMNTILKSVLALVVQHLVSAVDATPPLQSTGIMARAGPSLGQYVLSREESPPPASSPERTRPGALNTLVRV